MIPKPRLDAMTDGVFAVAMTLLVIDLKLPDDFHPQSASELLDRLAGLWDQALVYIVSFYVLGMRWAGTVRMAPRGEEVSDTYAKWAIVHLFLTTLVPFSTSVMGRYAPLAPAIWLYAANTILFALVALRMAFLTEHDHGHAPVIEDKIGLYVLIASSLMTVAISPFAPRLALFAYLLNLFDGAVRRVILKRRLATA